MIRKGIVSSAVMLLLSTGTIQQAFAIQSERIEVPQTSSTYQFFDIDGNSLIIQIQTFESVVKIVTKDPYGYTNDQEYTIEIKNESETEKGKGRDNGKESTGGGSFKNPTVNESSYGQPVKQPAASGAVDPMSPAAQDGQSTLGGKDKNSVQFGDLNNHWAKENVGVLSFLGVVNGYRDGTFRPEKTVSRAEFAAMLVNAIRLTKVSDSNLQGYSGFSDVTITDWYYPFVNFLEERGYLHADKYDYKLRPNDPITREEVAQWLFVESAKNKQRKEVRYIDVTAGKDEEAIVAAYVAGLLNGYPDLTFRPANKLTRAEAAIVISRYLQFKGVLIPK